MRRPCFGWLIVLGGCVGGRTGLVETSRRELVWPPPPQRPRLAYLGSIESDYASRVRSTPNLGSLLWGRGPVPRLVTPQSVAVHADGHRVAIADPQAGCVHVLNTLDSSAVTVGGGHRLNVALDVPVDVAWWRDTLCIADAGRAVVELVEPDGHHEAIGAGDLRRPASLAVAPGGGFLLVGDAGAHALVAFDDDGHVLRRIGSRGAGPGEFNHPAHVAFDASGGFVVADALNFRVVQYGADGRPAGAFGRKGDASGDFALPKGIAVDSRGRIWVADAQFENLQAFDPDGRLLLVVGGEGREPGQFWLPGGLAIDGRDRLWVADTYNRRVQVFQILPE